MVAGCALRSTDAGQTTGVKRGGCSCAGLGHRDECDGIHVRQRAAIPATTGSQCNNKLVEVFLHDSKGSGVQSYLPFNYPDYVYYRDHTKSLEGLMAFEGDGTEAIWNHAGAGEIVHGQLVSGNLFQFTGVKALAGRTLSVGDDRIDNPRQVVVLSYPFWKQKLGGDPGVVGKSLMLDGAEFMMSGVEPDGFTGLMVGNAPDFWAPLTTLRLFSHGGRTG